MKGADDGPAALTTVAIHHPCAAVPAQVVEGANHAICPAHQDGAFPQHVKGDPVARIGQVAFMAGDLPMGQENMGLFQIKQGGGVVGPTRQAAPIPCIGNGEGVERMGRHGKASVAGRFNGSSQDSD